MKGRKHLVSSCGWDSSLDNEAKGFELQNQLSQWSNDGLLKELEEIFDAFCPENRLWRIDRVDLALGKIDYDNLEQELPRRFRSMLVKELGELRLQQEENHSAFLESESAASNLEVIEYFLIKGTMPWFYQSSMGSFRELFANELKSYPEGLTKLIRRIGREPGVSQRILWQLNDEKVSDLNSGFWPENLETIGLPGNREREEDLFYSYWPSLAHYLTEGSPAEEFESKDTPEDIFALLLEFDSQELKKRIIGLGQPEKTAQNILKICSNNSLRRFIGAFDLQYSELLFDVIFLLNKLELQESLRSLAQCDFLITLPEAALRSLLSPTGKRNNKKAFLQTLLLDFTAKERISAIDFATEAAGRITGSGNKSSGMELFLDALIVLGLDAIVLKQDIPLGLNFQQNTLDSIEFLLRVNTLWKGSRDELRRHLKEAFQECSPGSVEDLPNSETFNKKFLGAVSQRINVPLVNLKDIFTRYALTPSHLAVLDESDSTAITHVNSEADQFTRGSRITPGAHVEADAPVTLDVDVVGDSANLRGLRPASVPQIMEDTLSTGDIPVSRDSHTEQDVFFKRDTQDAWDLEGAMDFEAGVNIETAGKVARAEGIEAIGDVERAEGVETGGDVKTAVGVEKPLNVQSAGNVKTTDIVEKIENIETGENVAIIGDVKTAVGVEEALDVQWAGDVKTTDIIEKVENVETAEFVETREDVKTAVGVEKPLDVQSAGNVKTEKGVKKVENIETAESSATSEGVRTANIVEKAINIQSAGNVKTAESVETTQSVATTEDVKTAENVETALNIQSAGDVKTAEDVEKTFNVHSTGNAKTSESVEKTLNVHSAGDAKTAEGIEKTLNVLSAGDVKTADVVEKVLDVESAGDAKTAKSVEKALNAQSAGDVKTSESVEKALNVQSAGDAKTAEGIEKTLNVLSSGDVKTADVVEKVLDVQSAGDAKTAESIEKVLDVHSAGDAKTAGSVEKVLDVQSTGYAKTADNVEKALDVQPVGDVKTADIVEMIRGFEIERGAETLRNSQVAQEAHVAEDVQNEENAALTPGVVPMDALQTVKDSQFEKSPPVIARDTQSSADAFPGQDARVTADIPGVVGDAQLPADIHTPRSALIAGGVQSEQGSQELRSLLAPENTKSIGDTQGAGKVINIRDAIKDFLETGRMPGEFSGAESQSPAFVTLEFLRMKPNQFLEILQELKITQSNRAMFRFRSLLDFQGLLRAMQASSIKPGVDFWKIEMLYNSVIKMKIRGFSGELLSEIIFDITVGAWIGVRTENLSPERILEEVIWILVKRYSASEGAIWKSIGEHLHMFPLAIQSQKIKEKIRIKSASFQSWSKPLDGSSLGAKDIANYHVKNAGLVLLQGYMNLYFERLGLLGEDGFQSEEAARKAVHYLQYLVTGETETEEHNLVLNKILCGINPQTPVEAGIEMVDSERELAHGLIEASIGYWTALGEGSVDGFRGNWLIRDATLTEKENSWELTVEKRAYDLLLDKAPFSYSRIHFRWMSKMIIVNWV